MNKTRLEAFSDGVIAIIITIMVLEIKTPHGAEWRDLLPLYPVVISYVLSFMYVAIYWGNHHHLLHTVTKVTPAIIWANAHLLFWLSLIPFVTAWMGENHFAPHTVILYAVFLMLCGGAFAILQEMIMKSNPYGPDMLSVLHRQQRKAVISMAIYLLAIGLTFVNTAISGVLIFLVAVLWFIPDTNIARALEE